MEDLGSVGDGGKVGGIVTISSVALLEYEWHWASVRRSEALGKDDDRSLALFGNAGIRQFSDDVRKPGVVLGFAEGVTRSEQHIEALVDPPELLFRFIDDLAPVSEGLGFSALQLDYAGFASGRRTRRHDRIWPFLASPGASSVPVSGSFAEGVGIPYCEVPAHGSPGLPAHPDRADGQALPSTS